MTIHCAYCGEELQAIAWRTDIGRWVTPGKSNGDEFCGPKCADKWKANGSKPKIATAAEQPKSSCYPKDLPLQGS